MTIQEESFHIVWNEPPIPGVQVDAVTVGEITSTIRRIPVEVVLGPEDGLPRKCVANLDTMATIRKDLLVERIVLLRSDKIIEIDAAITFALSIP